MGTSRRRAAPDDTMRVGSRAAFDAELLDPSGRWILVAVFYLDGVIYAVDERGGRRLIRAHDELRHVRGAEEDGLRRRLDENLRAVFG